MATNTLIPQYLEMDFPTMKERLKNLLAADTTFRDYNLEGANITVIMELICYLGALTTYYINRVAKNCYIDTSDAYEPTHMLASLRGYYPQGYRGSSTTLTVSISADTTSQTITGGHQVKIPAWKEIECPDEKDENGDTIKFATIVDTTETIPATASFPYTIKVPIRQGIITTYTYNGTDLVDNKLYLPSLKFDYDDDLDNDYPSVQVSVNDVIWTRVSDFYDDISGLSTIDEAYMLRYNKYQKYVIEFSSMRKVPTSDDVITVKLLECAGPDGNVGAGKITQPEDEFLYNISTSEYVLNEFIEVTNNYASTGGSLPDTIQEIKNASAGLMHSQYRNVTKNDYISHLESRSDIVAANVWGEQEVAPSGSVPLYNKVYISVIPDVWGTGTINTSAASAGIDIPYEYSTAWKVELSTFLEPRKMLSAYEEFVLPELVYFTFDIGLKIKRTYNFDNVVNAVKNKLEYYFQPSNRSFNETISFTDIIEYITDSSNVSPTDDFAQIKGIQLMMIRNITVIDYDPPYEPNDTYYPQYTVPSSTYTGDNRLRNIELGHNQFPVLNIDNCSFLEEV